MLITLRRFAVDDLGRHIPEVTLDTDTVCPSARHAAEALASVAQRGGPDAARDYNAVVDWAWASGITQYPADLVGNRCEIRKLPE